MPNFSVRPDTVVIDPKTGRFTRDGFLIMQAFAEAISEATSAYVLADAAQTLTNKTMDGDANTFTDIGTGSLKTRSGVDAQVITGTEGTNGNLAAWNADGDLVDGGVTASQVLDAADIGVIVQGYDSDLDAWAGKTAPSGVAVGTTDAQTMTNKIFGNAPILPEVTVAGVPSAATFDNGVVIVSNEAGGRTLATSDGTNWRRVSDGAIVS